MIKYRSEILSMVEPVSGLGCLLSCLAVCGSLRALRAFPVAVHAVESRVARETRERTAEVGREEAPARRRATPTGPGAYGAHDGADARARAARGGGPAAASRGFGRRRFGSAHDV